MRLDAAPFHVFEFDGSGWIHRASQSTWKLASEYCTDESRVLVFREENLIECGTLNIGLDFIAANGERVTSIQLVRDGQSVANIDWQADRVARFVKLHDVDGGQFIHDATALRASIQPASFKP